MLFLFTFFPNEDNLATVFIHKCVHGVPVPVQVRGQHWQQCTTIYLSFERVYLTELGLTKQANLTRQSPRRPPASTSPSPGIAGSAD